MELNFCERDDFRIPRRHGHEGENPHFVNVILVTQTEGGNKVGIGAVKFQIILEDNVKILHDHKCPGERLVAEPCDIFT